MKRRGIVVVHGIGSQNRADQLDIFTEPLVRFLGTAVGHDNIELNVKVPIETDDISWATVRIKDGPTVLEEWHIREAWWARSFKPSGAQSVLGWGIRAGIAIAGATVQNVLLRNVRRMFGRAPGTARTAEHVLGRPWDPASRDELPDSAQGIWNVAGAGWFRATLDALIWLLYCILYAVIIAVGLVVIVPLYVFLLIPLAFFFPESIGKVRVGSSTSLSPPSAISRRLPRAGLPSRAPPTSSNAPSGTSSPLKGSPTRARGTPPFPASNPSRSSLIPAVASSPTMPSPRATSAVGWRLPPPRPPARASRRSPGQPASTG